MKLALIHDWFDKYGGAERVVNSIDKCLSFDYYFAYADIMKREDKLTMFNGKNPEVNTSYLLRFLGKKFRFALPFFPLVTKSFNAQNREKYDVDLVISSSWCLSKGFRIGNETHVCYMQARNFKYVWEEYDNYFPGIIGLIFLPFRKYLQKFDRKMAKNPDYIIANSIYVQNWIEKNYKVKSSVIYPPVSVENFTLRTTKISDSEYYVTVGRLVKYKRFDLLIEAFIKSNKKLIVIGDGSERSKLERLAVNSDKIIFTGYLSSRDINDYISNAKAFVFSSLEDFGIAPVEAQACGTPVIAYGKGGVLETIIEGKTGVFFYKQEVDKIVDAVTSFEENIMDFNPIVIRENSKKFSEEVFMKKLNLFIEETCRK